MSYHLYRARDIMAHVREAAAKATTLDDLEKIERSVAETIGREHEETQHRIRHYTDAAVRGRLDDALARIAAADGEAAQ